MQESSETAQERFSRCPYCLAVFRVRPEKLAVRQGEVRCGACREVFNATWHFVELDDEGRFVPEMVADTVPTPADPDSEAATGEDSESVEEPSTSPGDSVDDGAREDPGSAAVEDDTDIEIPDPDPEQAVGTDPADLNPSSESDTDRKGDSGLGQYERTAPVADALAAAADSDQADTDPREPDPESGAEGRLDLETGDLSLMELEVTPKPAPGNWFNVDPDSILEHNPFQGEREGGDSGIDTTKPASINMHGVDAYIEDRPNPLVGLFWFLVSVGFVFLLGLQVRSFFVDRYAQDEQYRPYLSLFCRIASCELPARRDTYRFAITNTRIDLHPDEPGALRITVKLVNQATFAQPYPDLQLTLTDRVGRVVGRRTFSPDFYLAKNSANLLDSGELGSVEFDLARPHEKAVGFVVDIVRESGA